MYGYLPGGTGWYKKKLKIADELKGKKLYVYFEGVYNRSEVYINGHLLGKRPNGYISFMYDITSYVKYDSDNMLTVKVDHSRRADFSAGTPDLVFTERLFGGGQSCAYCSMGSIYLSEVGSRKTSCSSCRSGSRERVRT